MTVPWRRTAFICGMAVMCAFTMTGCYGQTASGTFSAGPVSANQITLKVEGMT